MTNSMRRTYIRVISFLSVFCVVVTVAAIVYSVRASRLERRERITYERAVNTLCESLDSISISLQKSIYTGDADALMKTGNDLCRQAVAAKESLAVLSPEGEMSRSVYKFLSQVGEFTLALARSSENGIDRRTAESLGALYDYASSLSGGMSEICLDYFDGGVSFGEAMESLSLDGSALPDDFYSRMTDAGQTLTDYPTLVYDGPFSDNISGKTSYFLNGKSEITKKEALKKAAELLGVKSGELRAESDADGDIELYCFSKGGISVGITKKGGYLCYLLSDSFALESTISADEAVRRGEEYLKKLGFEDMKSNYYSIYDGVCTINYAYTAEGVTYYTDLIKVSVSLDTGRLLAFDSKTYLLNHHERVLPGERLTQGQAAKKVPQSLETQSVSLAVIPLENGKEAFCYELLCRDSEQKQVLVYIDALTGKQQDLLLLLKTDGGVLTK